MKKALIIIVACTMMLCACSPSTLATPDPALLGTALSQTDEARTKLTQESRPSDTPVPMDSDTPAPTRTTRPLNTPFPTSLPTTPRLTHTATSTPTLLPESAYITDESSVLEVLNNAKANSGKHVKFILFSAGTVYASNQDLESFYASFPSKQKFVVVFFLDKYSVDTTLVYELTDSGKYGFVYV